MRNAYIQPDDNLTPFGRWLAARIPHSVIRRNPWGHRETDFIFRISGFKPYCRFTVIDYTRFMDDWHLTLFGFQFKTNKRCKAGGN